MAVPAHDPNADLDAVLRRRAELRDSILSLEQALTRPAHGRGKEWTADVLESLRHVQDDVDAHIAGTESADGLYAQILENAPRLANAINRLRSEHQEIKGLLAHADGSLAASPDEEEWVADVREELTRLMGRLVRHRQKGADLLYEAFHIDVGGET